MLDRHIFLIFATRNLWGVVVVLCGLTLDTFALGQISAGL